MEVRSFLSVYSNMNFLTKCLFLFSIAPLLSATEHPNVVLVITDDQGYGDLACHGNPEVITPNIDKLSSEAVNLSDFHVFPTCSPTRAALMTGHWANRTGVWHTIQGRSLIRKNEVTLAQMFKDGGYETGIFGKWHLGDAYPFRPEDKGFTYTYYHGAGGVGQTPDVWNNSYFGGAYYNNGEITKAEGYCTDVFFEEGNKFIKKNAEEKKPFFAYISTNAPHVPLLCPQKYIDMYEKKGLKARIATFLGMITNVDENVGNTRELIKELGIEDNTIFIFMTDNGSAGGSSLYNANMRGKKNSPYDGGHRVPFMIYFPKAGLNQKVEVKTLTHVVDIAPTLLEMCGLKKPAEVKFDGLSIKPLMEGKDENWKERFVITDSQRVVDPIKWRQCSVMGQDWRLVNGTELYYLPEDPGQTNDIAVKHPERVAKMRAFYEEWWADIEPGFSETAEFIIGNPSSEVVRLTSHDWISEKYPPWNQSQVRKITSQISDAYDAYWAVDVEVAGTYQVKLYRWAPEANIAMNSEVSAEPDQPGSGTPYGAVDGHAVEIESAIFIVDGKVLEEKKVDGSMSYVSFDITLSKGKKKLSPHFILKNKKHLGAVYAVIEKK